MELAMELEDDLFFADLSKQISLLIMDDDNEDSVASYPSFQDFSRVNYPIAPSPFMLEQVCRRESKGTGVFIPKSSQPRRKHRHGRCNSSSNTRSQYRQNYNIRMVPQASYNNSFNPKKAQGYKFTSSARA